MTIIDLSPPGRRGPERNAEDIAKALGGKRSSKGGWSARCPAHDDKNRSFSVSEKGGRVLVHCHAGCTSDAVIDELRKLALWPEGLEGGRHTNERAGAPRREVAHYDYKDRDGAMLFQVVRLEPKDFRQRRHLPGGGWDWSQGERRVLYRWPELVKFPDAPIFVCEGEKDVERLEKLELCATTVANGNWNGVDVSDVADRDVIVLEDADTAGVKKALAAATALQPVAKTIRIVRLPGQEHTAARHGKDVSDWLDEDAARGGEELFDLCIAAPLWDPPNGPEDYGSSPNERAESPPIDLAATFIFLGDAPADPPRELIKRLLPAYGVAVTGGQSSAGKTFIEIHKAMCLAKALPFFGHKIIERVGTAFVAAEGRALIPNRFAAALMKQAIKEGLPIAWLKQLPDFSSANGIKLFVRQLRELDKTFQEDFGVRLGQVPIDTVAACFGMKDEDDNAEATKVCNVMRVIGEETGALMAPVHHYGKNPESGLRGASAWKGSADVVLGVLADIDPLTGRASNREMVCAKARDGEQGPISPFALEFVPLGLDGDGEVYGSCCVVPVEGASRFDKTAAAGTKGQHAIQDAIAEALDSQGKTIVPRADMPAVRAAKVTDVRREFDRRYVVDEATPEKASDAKRKAFKRALDKLSPSKFGAGSAEGSDWIWKIT